jgi:ankyrin repeat protein
MKMTRKHFNALLDLAGVPKGAVWWKDDDGNGSAPIEELYSFNRDSLKKVWELSSRVVRDGGLSMNDYHAEIMAAIAEKRKPDLSLLLEQEIDPSFSRYSYTTRNAKTTQTTVFGTSLLDISAAVGNTAMLAYFTKKGADINDTSSGRFSPLFTAARFSQLDAAKWLVAAGADVNFSTKEKITPIVIAASAGSYDVLKFLADKGADITVIDNQGRSLLLASAAAHSLECVRFLLDKGLDLQAVDRQGMNAATLASTYYTWNGVLLPLKEDVLLFLMNRGIECEGAEKEPYIV